MAGACWVSCSGCYQPIVLLQNNSESLFLCQSEHRPFCLKTLSLFMWKVILNSNGTVKGAIPVAVPFSFGKHAIWMQLQRQQRGFFSSVSSEQQSFFGTPITSESSSAWLSQPTQEIPHLDEPDVPRREAGCGSHVMCISAEQHQPLHAFPLHTDARPSVLVFQFNQSCQRQGMGAGRRKSFRQQEWLRRSHFDLHEEKTPAPHSHFLKRWGISKCPGAQTPPCCKGGAEQQDTGMARTVPTRARKGHSPTALRIRVCSAPPSSRAVSFSTQKEAVCLSLPRSGFTLPSTEPCEYLLVSSRAILESVLLCKGTGLLWHWHPSVDACWRCWHSEEWFW